MKAKAFIQIVPERRSDGVARKLKIQNVTQGFPYSPAPGAIVVGIELDVDEELLKPRVLEGKVPPGAATVVLEVQENGGS